MKNSLKDWELTAYNALVRESDKYYCSIVFTGLHGMLKNPLDEKESYIPALVCCKCTVTDKISQKKRSIDFESLCKALEFANLTIFENS